MHQEPFQRFMTLMELLLEFMMITDIPDWGWCPWLCFVLSRLALRMLHLKFGWNQLHLKASRTLLKMDDIAGGLQDAGSSWLVVILDHEWDMSSMVQGVSVSNFVKIWCLEAEIWWDIAWFRVSPRVGWLGSGLGPRLGISLGWSINISNKFKGLYSDKK